ncbi:MAG TPA: sigma-70 family RNA polymerase sigma factor [Usitatibacter sp.]|nr:sigma-70 family RNA polymerase sigma factor [Usitatibacter sp.]
MPNESTAALGPEGELARRIADAAPGIDGQAEAALYRLLAPRVRLYGRRHLRDDEAAADLMQQVMVMAIEKLRAGELREPERIASFAFGACRMVTMEMRRGERRREALLEKYGADLAIADIAVPPRLDEAKVAACLKRLAERERAVLIASFDEEEPAEKVGATLGLTAGNVRVIRHRALQRLRECVTGRGAP